MELPKNIQDGTHLPIMEAFYSIQGEGFHVGRPAYFIRLAGCDVGCVWCDVKESWNREDHTVFTVEEIVDGLRKSGADFCVITGGEPAMYDLAELTLAIKDLGIYIAIETSGAYPIKGVFDWVCLSPKKFKAPIKSVIEVAKELKVIVFNTHDFKWGEDYASQVTNDCQLYFQPEWERSEEMSMYILDYIKEHPKWKISIQTHKFLGVD